MSMLDLILRNGCFYSSCSGIPPVFSAFRYQEYADTYIEVGAIGLVL